MVLLQKAGFKESKMLEYLDKLMWNIYHQEVVMIEKSLFRGYFVFGKLVKIGNEWIGE